MCEGLEAIHDRLAALEHENDHLTDRVASLETDLERAQETIATLESEIHDLQTANAALERETTDLHDRLETHDTTLTQTTALAEATRKRTGTNKARIEELQARELEKGAHLRDELVDPEDINVVGDYLERFTKESGQTYVRLPDHDDPLKRGGSPTLTHGDLLPIQQLARMDADMLRSTTNALPTRLAANLWKARTDSSVGDDPWTNGCTSIREYVKASDLKHWIRRQEPGVSDSYAKKLVSRTIDAVLDLSNNRLAVRKRTERKNGLEYTERRLIIPTDAEIPGETKGADTKPPETADVLG
ncbi:hypothetical protein [Natronosalvus rutilus]|uniref:Uncharacterized protein n=1 Tax=Natronosalvus rutilus TaxID=2953753 RepID=A0A9E7NE98_9EURY|nr:hypothetical protein [Natronosalvus rutilus]UTF55433.1 hypothetical protein NGM29_05860 [Natronosalvus rutilus]